MCGLVQPVYPNLLVDYKHAEDAGVYKINETTALVQTLDFFPPIVDDPYIFGQIAAANSLSDIYAMGATPITAMSIVCFPQKKLDIKHLRAIIEGGMSKLVEANTALVGGHSVDDPELKYGLSVTGTVHPDKILLNNTPKPNEKIILTKKIGSGIINTAQKGGMASQRSIDASIEVMRTLNKLGAEISMKYNISSCTDVTGFGLLGHACEMITDAQVGMKMWFKNLPILPDVYEYADMILIPAGCNRNKRYRQHQIVDFEKRTLEVMDIMFDPQTSGGLLMSLPENEADALISELNRAGVEATIIGETTDRAEMIEVVE